MDERYFYSIASGSKGNCALYVSQGTAVLIDLGVSERALGKALQSVGLSADQLAGVLLTHEHTDHVKGLKTFAKKHRVPVYAPREVAERLAQDVPEAAHALRPFVSTEGFSLGRLQVESFRTPHDAAESVGYVLHSMQGTLGYATDLGFVTGPVRQALMGCDAVVLESNHDPILLETGPYPYPLRQRVAGPGGHLSNQDCAALAVELVQNGTNALFLAHLSEQNNTPVTALRETQQTLREYGLACELYVLGQAPMAVPVALGREAQACCM